MNKLTTINTYPAVTNYWAPLNDDDEEEETKEEEILMLQQLTKPPDQRAKSNKWTRRIEEQQEQQIKRKEEEIIIDSGATSHFVSKTLDLPQTDPSQITVYLPDDSTLKATNKTQLPFKQLSAEAREAHILQGLAKSLLSVNKMAEHGYTTIFRLGNKGVTMRKKGTLTITMSEPPVLQGCKKKGEKLWTVTAS